LEGRGIPKKYCYSLEHQAPNKGTSELSKEVHVLVTPLLNIKTTLDGIAQNKRAYVSTVAFFVNPPEGVEHGQKCVESKNRQHFDFKIFS
jgi:hypothetical protein